MRMTSVSLLHEVPLGITLLFAGLEIGYRLRCRRRVKGGRDSIAADEKGLAMTSLSAILGLLLAFTYGVDTIEMVESEMADG